MNHTNEFEVFQDEMASASSEPGHELNGAAVLQGPMTQSLRAPMCRLETQMTALRSELAQSRKRIYIVEEHPAFRAGLTQILDDSEDLTVCGTAGAVKQALPAIARTKPDLVLADISLSGKSGLKLIKKLRSVDRSVKLLVISMHNEPLHAARVLRSGGDGYILKKEDPDEIIYAVHDVLGGHIYVSEEVIQSPRGRGRNRNFRRANASAGSTNGLRA